MRKGCVSMEMGWSAIKLKSKCGSISIFQVSKMKSAKLQVIAVLADRTLTEGSRGTCATGPPITVVVIVIVVEATRRQHSGDAHAPAPFHRERVPTRQHVLLLRLDARVSL